LSERPPSLDADKRRSEGGKGWRRTQRSLPAGEVAACAGAVPPVSGEPSSKFVGAYDRADGTFDGMSRTIRQQIQADLVVALKAGDVVTVSVLRTTLAALANAEAVDPAAGAPLVRAGLLGDVERRNLATDDVVAVVAAERDELQAAADLLDQAGRAAAAGACRARAAILGRYLAA